MCSKPCGYIAGLVATWYEGFADAQSISGVVDEAERVAGAFVHHHQVVRMDQVVPGFLKQLGEKALPAPEVYAHGIPCAVCITNA